MYMALLVCTFGGHLLSSHPHEKEVTDTDHYLALHHTPDLHIGHGHSQQPWPRHINSTERDSDTCPVSKRSSQQDPLGTKLIQAAHINN